MDVGDIKSGRVERGQDRPAKTDRTKVNDGVRGPAPDSATISQDSRETLAAVDSLAEKLKQQEPDRRAFIERIRQKVREGELDNEKVYRDTAHTLLEGGF